MNPKIAIIVENGMVIGVRSNIGANLDVEIIDLDSQEEDQADANSSRYNQIQFELEFGNY
jgi:hypothetical protein